MSQEHSLEELEAKLQRSIYEDAAEALFAFAPKVLQSIGCGVSKKETGLTFNQIRALVFLSRKKRHLGEIAEDRGVSPASATALIDSLEKSGYVTREMDSVDNRKVLIGLTEKGMKTYQQLSERSQNILREELSYLSVKDAEEFARIVHLLNRKP